MTPQQPTPQARPISGLPEVGFLVSKSAAAGMVGNALEWRIE
jgi:hypothetical protein